MKYFFYGVVTLVAIAAIYTSYYFVQFKWMYYSINNPGAEFLISGNEESNITLVEFVNYSCGYCKDLHPAVKELQEVRKDIRYIARPITFQAPEEEKATRVAIAAGLQGKFYEFHDAFLEYPEPQVPDDFIQELSALYGINYEQLMQDSESKKVEKIIESNMKAVMKAGIYSVPSFMIGKNIYFVDDTGLPDLKQLLEMIASAEK